jgi:HSP20 family protein
MRIADLLFEEMDSPQNVSSRTARLALDAYETPEAVVIEAFVPGVNAEDIDIQVDGGVLTISGTMAPRVEDANYIMREVPRATFARTLKLNMPIEVDDITAEVENGVLTLTLPKAEIARPRAIKVQAKS